LMFHFPHYFMISCLESSCETRFCWGFDKTLPLWFGFDGAISTIAKQEGGSTWGLHLGIILFILLYIERVCGASMLRNNSYFCRP
jgi:hypothetical protein